MLALAHRVTQRYGAPPNAVFGTKLKCWYDAARGITLSGANVSQWNDLTATAANLTQGTAGNRPVYEATSGPNGLPRVRMQDTARFMATAAASLTTAAGWRGSTYYVGNVGASAGAIRAIFILRGSGAPPVSMCGIAASNKLRTGIGFQTSGAIILEHNTPAYDANNHLFATHNRAAGSETRIDGALASGSFGVTEAFTQLDHLDIGHVGGLAAGAISESFVVVGEVSAQEDAIVSLWLRHKYALP
jgi:hypothetical protein